jgi:hypothetical protein
MPAQEESIDSFAAQRFQHSRSDPSAGALLSVCGVGLFCFSLLLVWFPWQYAGVTASEIPGWIALALPPFDLFVGLIRSPASGAIALIPCALEGVSLYILSSTWYNR